MNTLTIRISRDHIIFCTYDRLQNTLPVYEVCDNDPDISLNANIHKAIKASTLAQSNYNFVDAYFTGTSTLVPLKEFEEEYINDIYFFNFPSLKETDKVFYDTLPYLNALLLFSIDKGVCHSLKEFYPQVKFHSTLTPLILQFVARYPFSATEPRLYCYFNEDKLTTIVISNGQLDFMNTYTHHRINDALYYIASVAQRTGLTSTAKNIYISGDHDTAQNITRSLDKIGFHGFHMADSEELSHHPVSEISEFPYDMKVMLLKAY